MSPTIEGAAQLRHGLINHVPLWRYRPDGENGGWESAVRSLKSPADDGSVAYFFDTLTTQRPDDDGPHGMFDRAVARAACQYIRALALKQDVQIADGPYLLMVEDDGCVPPGFAIVRALIWVEEFDEQVPSSSGDAAAAEKALIEKYGVSWA